MGEATFKREVSYMSKRFVANEAGTDGTWKEELVTKEIEFRELDRTDRKQHKLHFKIVSLFTNGDKDEDGGGLRLDSDTLYDLSQKAMKELAVLNEDFKEGDRNEMLSDSGAIFNFGYWFLGEKVTPFFSNLMRS